MEKVTEQDGMEVYENDIAMALSMFCESHSIEDLKKESQSVWNAALRYIRKIVFPVKDILKAKTNINISSNIMPSNYNRYNYELVNNICDIYIDLCFLYDKEVSIIGFSNITGIDTENINNWGNNNGKLSQEGFVVYKKLYEYREESLSDKLATGNKNPVGILAILNRHYQWNLPGVSREKANNTALPMSELLHLGANNGSFQQLEDNNSIVDSNTNS
jgi:hypothetical protein